MGIIQLPQKKISLLKRGLIDIVKGVPIKKMYFYHYTFEDKPLEEFDFYGEWNNYCPNSSRNHVGFNAYQCVICEPREGENKKQILRMFRAQLAGNPNLSAPQNSPETVVHNSYCEVREINDLLKSFNPDRAVEYLQKNSSGSLLGACCQRCGEVQVHKKWCPARKINLLLKSLGLKSH